MKKKVHMYKSDSSVYINNNVSVPVFLSWCGRDTYYNSLMLIHSGLAIKGAGYNYLFNDLNYELCKSCIISYMKFVNKNISTDLDVVTYDNIDLINLLNNAILIAKSFIIRPFAIGNDLHHSNLLRDCKLFVERINNSNLKIEANGLILPNPL